MDVSNIYGPVDNGAEVILAIGHYNNIHGLLTHVPNDVLQMKSLADIISPAIIELVLTYNTDNKFSLAVKDTDMYIGVESPQNETRTVTAVVSDIKTYFSLDFSAVDKTPRNKILSGVLCSLHTVINDQQYTVTWRIRGFANGDLIIFLPTTWYEKDTNVCIKRFDTPILLDKLNQLRFRGYTNQKWCEQLPSLTHCTGNNKCGKCLGNCHQNDHICYPDTNGSFICGPSDDSKDIVDSITTANTTSSISRSTATWLAVGAIIIIVSLLVYGLVRKYY